MLDFIKKGFEKVNVYHLPHYLLIALWYYLMVNSLFQFFVSYILKGYNKEFIKHIPPSVFSINDEILNYLIEWMLFTGVMGLLLIIASFLLNMANGIPFFGNKFTFNHLDFGFHIGIWFMIMFASCSIYFYSWKLFILCFIIFEVIGAIRRSKERK